MFSKNSKKKASTLLEVIISLAIVALLVIPAMNMIVGSVKNVQKTKVKEKAESIGKKVVEEIKAIDLSNMEDEVVLTTGVVLKRSEEDILAETVLSEGYKVNVSLKKNNDISYTSPSDGVDGEFNIYLDSGNRLILEDINSTEESRKMKIDVMNNETETILIINNSASDTIEIKKKDSLSEYIEISKRFLNSNNLKCGYLKFNLLENNTNNILVNFEVKNLMTEDFNFYVSTRENSVFLSKETIDKSSLGSILVTKDNFTPKPIGSMYDLTVTVERDDKILFTLNGYKNINL